MQAKTKSFLLKAKQYIKAHPRAVFCYGTALFLFVALFIGFSVPMLKLGAQILTGEIKNTLTFDQLTGIVLTLTGVIIFLCNLVLVNTFLRIGDSVAKEESQKKAQIPKITLDVKVIFKGQQLTAKQAGDLIADVTEEEANDIISQVEKQNVMLAYQFSRLRMGYEAMKRLKESSHSDNKSRSEQ